MANPLKGEIEITAGDKSYILFFDIDAICAMEEATGKGFGAIAAEMQNPALMSISMVRRMLHAALQQNHPDVTLKEAGEIMVAGGGMLKAIQKIGAAINAAFPEASGTRRPPKRPKGRTGSTS
ncbi:hypothetical protein JQ600_35500 [Bradyrhizobium sp. AUGA SZCCT0176]|uniref:hypothetical protein n=1 Tax=Bradyrhizobium sp. AUGA SZCCT0176 TaxID=2807664 RepID=UPI001BA6C50E|nr:hypothetical protein [Bradyrhizobium sp. AUGA SZCCT0176]MBR1230203.1 hypothetical protein [Bradyrhizobium sp. AUGA SZCCT0176]